MDSFLSKDQVSTKAGQLQYLALSGSQARKAALLSAAKCRLSEEDYAELIKLHKKASNGNGPRNSVIHGTWAITEDEPDGMLLCDPAEYVKFEAALLYGFTFTVDDTTNNDELARYINKTDAIKRFSYEVYELEDLRQIATNLANTVKLITEFRQKLRAKYQWQFP